MTRPISLLSVLPKALLKTEARLRQIVVAWRLERVAFPNSDPQPVRSGFRRAYKNATPAGRTVLKELHDAFSFFEPSMVPAALRDNWKRDLEAVFRCVQRARSRWQPGEDEVVTLAAALPRAPSAAEPLTRGAGPARRELERLARKLPPREAKDAQLPYSAEEVIADSYRTVQLLRAEVEEHRSVLSELSQRHELSVSDEPWLASKAAVERRRREIEGLLAVIELRVQLDVLRLLWLRASGPLKRVPFEIDATLRDIFGRLVQSAPIHVGVTPNLGTPDYARTSHPAREVVVRRYRRLLEIPLRAEVMVASSAMALLSDAMLAASRARSRARGPLRIGYFPHVYFETRQMFSKDGALFAENEVEAVALTEEDGQRVPAVDLVLCEAIGNHSAGRVLPRSRLESVLRRAHGVRTVVADITLSPFSIRWLSRMVPAQAVLVAVDSVTKYAQLGTNACIGGIATFLPGSSAAAREWAAKLRDHMTGLTEVLGQHMDVRLAASLGGSAELLRRRLTRMRRNARIVARWFRAIRSDEGVVRHADAGDVCSTLVFIQGRLNWRAVEDPELRKLRRWRPGPKRLRALLEAIEHQFIAEPEAEVNGGIAPVVRVSSSFGFSTTSVHAIIPRSKDETFWYRISAGTESVEQLLYLLENHLTDYVEPFLVKKWEGLSPPPLTLFKNYRGDYLPE